MPAWKKEFKVGGEEKGLERFLKADPLELGIYNAKDAYMTLLLSYALEERLREEVENWEDLYESRLQLSLYSKEMRQLGVVCILENLRKHLKSFKNRRYKAGMDACGYPEAKAKVLNPNSPDQIKDFFFKHLRARSTKRSIKTGKPSLDEKVLQHLSINIDDRIAKAARIQIRFRRWAKLVSMTRKLWQDRTKVIHADGQCWGTKTGRWAYRDPNLTTIPKSKFRLGKTKDAEGNRKKILVAPGLRDIIGVRLGKQLVEVDYSQLELRILGYLTDDPLLIGWYEEGLDVHTENAKRWFRTSNPTKFQRGFAKTIVYAMNYGGGAKTIWSNLVVDYPGLYLGDIQRYLDLWYMHHPKIKTWQEKQLRSAEELGYVEIPLSKKRVHLYGDKPDPPKVYNPPVQGTASALIDRAMLRIWPQLQNKAGHSLLLQVHDALIGESPNPQELARIFITEMEKPIELNGRTVVFPTDVKIGPTWGEAEDVPREEIFGA
jgi:DNA polymerase-1